MTEPVQTPFAGDAPSSAARLVPPAVLAVFAAVLMLQMLGEWPAALGALIGAGLVAGAGWTPLVLRRPSRRLGGAALVGGLALVAAFVGAAIVGGAYSKTVEGTQAGVALLFSLSIVAPAYLAAAVGLAALQARLAGGKA